MSRNGDWTFLFDKSKLFILGVYFLRTQKIKPFIVYLVWEMETNTSYIHIREETIKSFVLVVEKIRGRGGV